MTELRLFIGGPADGRWLECGGPYHVVHERHQLMAIASYNPVEECSAYDQMVSKEVMYRLEKIRTPAKEFEFMVPDRSGVEKALEKLLQNYWPK